MDFREAIWLALQSLWQNKLRTVLTLLGVMIGVASVIAVVTLINGANTYVTTKFTRYGADVFTVSRMPSIIMNPKDYERFQRRKNITYDDYKYVEDNCKRCLAMGAQQATVAKVTRGTHSITDTQVRGYTWQMPQLQNLDMAEGRGLTAQDDEHASPVAIIGSDIRDQLFAGVDPLGQELRVDGQPYTVIGVAEKQGSTFGQSQDNWVGDSADFVHEDLWLDEEPADLREGGVGGTGAGAGRRRSARADALAAARRRRGSRTRSSWTSTTLWSASSPW